MMQVSAQWQAALHHGVKLNFQRQSGAEKSLKCRSLLFYNDIFLSSWDFTDVIAACTLWLWLCCKLAVASCFHHN